MSTLLKGFFDKGSVPKDKMAALAYLASLDHLLQHVPSVGKKIIDELKAQRSRLKLIASENYSSLSVQLAMGNLLTDKYSEGSPFRRFYSCCENVDAIEWDCAETAKELFGAEYASVQPHCGADANLLAVMAILNDRVQGDIVSRLGYKTVNNLSEEEYDRLRRELMDVVCLGPSMNSGGHLTHGDVRLNIISKLVKCRCYGVNLETERFDYDEIARRAKEVRPKILIAGYSAYSRRLDFSILKQIADDVGAVLVADVAHFAGLIAGGVFSGGENPVPYADILTTTTHKTLRGPRGGLVLSKAAFASTLDKACPMMMGGPLPHVIAAKAVALKEALSVDFKKYAHAVVENARALADRLMVGGLRLLTGGTDNHMVLVDVSAIGLTGRIAEDILGAVGISVNRNSIPTDEPGKWDTSGIRLGTPALTTLGMGVHEMHEIADILVKVLRNIVVKHNVDGNSNKKFGELPENISQEAKSRVLDLLARFPLYPEVDLSVLEQ
ncbi:glycine hydroxymethyltransferase [Chlamydiifrater volucris]|uniref:glycine hydroxymethyltransferase n=1 Tax=Chlamydiifrater volucris TaxID=2681470 RepID=UPI001BCE58D6|nr:glycine hydroxymethyltransferase [Chlamydiifrater volucris]